MIFTKFGHPAAAVLLLSSFAVSFGLTEVQAQDSRKIDRSVGFLENARRGRDMLSYIHFGGKYLSHDVLSTHPVADRNKITVPGHWAVKVVFEWSTAFGDNTSTATYFFDEMGDIYDVQVTTTSILSQPFELANATIQVLGNIILEAMKDQISAKDRADIQKAIDEADAKKLMITGLNLQKRLGL